MSAVQGPPVHTVRTSALKLKLNNMRLLLILRRRDTVQAQGLVVTVRTTVAHQSWAGR